MLRLRPVCARVAALGRLPAFQSCQSRVVPAPGRACSSVTAVTPAAPDPVPPLPPPPTPVVVEKTVLFSPVLPASVGRWDPRRLMSVGVNMRLKSWLPRGIEQVSVTMTPREGAALARLRFDKNVYKTNDELLAALADTLSHNRSNQWVHKLISMPATRPFLVLGEPFLEDVISNWTSKTLRVTVFLDRAAAGSTGSSFSYATRGFAAPLTLEEELYSVFRLYGKIDNLLVSGDAVAQAGNVGGATVEFHSTYSAMAAILCARGLRLPGGRVLHADYIPFLATRTLSKFMKDHTRIALALLALFLAALSIAVLDPLRKLCIKLRLSNPRGGMLTNPSSRSWLYALPSSTLSNLKTSASTILPVSIARWLGPQTSSVGEKGLEKGEADKPHFPPPVGSRREDEMALEQWARMESKEPLVLCGHTGSGKISLIRQVFERVGINKVTHIDVHAMLEKKDDMMVHDLASAFGFYPGFRGVQLMTKLIDLITPGASVGVSVAGGGDYNQIVQVLDMTKIALEELKARRELHPEQHAHVPMFVFTGFNEDNEAKYDKLLPMLVAWSAEVSRHGIAQIMFATNSTMLGEYMSKYVPQKLDVIELHDVSFDVAAEYVQSRISDNGAPLSAEALAAIMLLGGRFQDLDQLVRMVRTGISPTDAADRIISKAEVYLRNILFRPSSVSDKPKQWRADQVWNVMLGIADSKTGEIPYDTTLFNVFKGDEVALQQLVPLDIISVSYKDGVPEKIRAGSTVMNEAVRRLARDAEVRPGMEVLCTLVWLAKERDTIEALESELGRLQSVIDSNYDSWWRRGTSPEFAVLATRQAYLLRELKLSQDKCAKWEARKDAALKAKAAFERRGASVSTAMK